MDEQKEWLLAQLSGARTPVSFVALLESRSKAFIIATFLAVLDLLQRQRLRLKLGIEPEDFALEVAPASGEDDDPAPGASGAASGDALDTPALAA